MKRAIDYFTEFVQDNERYPTLDEFKSMGYSKTTYYQCKKDYKPEKEEDINEKN